MASFKRKFAGLFGRTRAYALLTIARGRYERALAALPRIDGPALVVGSGPDAHLPAGVTTDWFVVTINASQTSTEEFGFKAPDLTLFRDGIINTGSHQDLVWDLLRGRHTKHLAPIWGGPNDLGLEELMTKYGYTADKRADISRYTRSAVILELTGVPIVNLSSRWSISNGMFAALLAHKLGGSPVVMTGFSFADPSYKIGQHVGKIRPHLWGDKLMCKQVVERGLPIYAAAAKFAEESGLRLWGGDSASRASASAVRSTAL